MGPFTELFRHTTYIDEVLCKQVATRLLLAYVSVCRMWMMLHCELWSAQSDMLKEWQTQKSHAKEVMKILEVKRTGNYIYLGRSFMQNGKWNTSRVGTTLKSRAELKKIRQVNKIHTRLYLNLSDPTSDVVRQYDFPVLLRYRKTSDTVFVAFVRPLSEPVRPFSSCSTDFSQQIVQVVLFLFLHDFPLYNCRIIISNPPTSLPPKTNKSWRVCGWQKNWIGKG
jgi:hypothetical protein